MIHRLRILDTRDFLAEEDSKNALAGYETATSPVRYTSMSGDDISDPKGDAPFLILPKEEFESVMGRLGIDNDTTVVAYDDGGNTWSARLWWALRYYGHENVKLLDGGLKKWTLEERPLETGVNTPKPATFTAQTQPELLSTVVRRATGHRRPFRGDHRLASTLSSTAASGLAWPARRPHPNRAQLLRRWTTSTRPDADIAPGGCACAAYGNDRLEPGTSA